MTLSLKGLAEIDERFKLFSFETSLGENLEIKIRSPLGLDETTDYTNDIQGLTGLEEGEFEELSKEEQRVFINSQYREMIKFLNKWLNILSPTDETYTEQEVITAYKIVSLHNQDNLLFKALTRVAGNLRKSEEGDEADDLPFLLVDP